MVGETRASGSTSLPTGMGQGTGVGVGGSPGVRAGVGRAARTWSSGPLSRRRLPTCRFMARCSSLLVKEAFSWTSMYLAQSRLTSASSALEPARLAPAWPRASCNFCSSSSSSSSSSLMSFREASTSVNTPDSTGGVFAGRERLLRQPHQAPNLRPSPGRQNHPHGQGLVCGPRLTEQGRRRVRGSTEA